ncbi:hypothetical protein GGI20_000136 [Coemansia sp. BCRC 34301]|nr:hypothetical protein GGI20_000136 [Coemansia sp. BCRC 34301]
MSGVGPSEAGERQLKRARSNDELVAKEEPGPQYLGQKAQQQQQWPESNASKQPAKIKLSLKLGVLKLQQKPATPAATVQRFERTELDSDDYSVDCDETEERRRLPDDMYMTPTSATKPSWLHESASLPALGSATDQASSTHTPRIKLRFSFKTEESAPITPVTATPGSRSKRAAWGESVPGSMSESESVVSYMDTDDSDGDGRTYEHSAPAASGATTPRTSGGTGRPRGRPPLRGRRSLSQSVRPTNSGLPGLSRKPTNALTTSVSLKSSLLRLVLRIRKRDSYGFFLEPVDTSAIPDYLGIIKSPMDLGTMQRKVETNRYRSIAEFRQDLLLICQNARKYNGDGSIYARSADRIQEYATVAIDRETAKLESVGRASIAPEDIVNDSDLAFGATPKRQQSYAQSPEYSRSVSPSPSRDDHSDGDYRRPTRRRWRASSASEQANPAAAATPASISDIFKWSSATTAAKRRARRASMVPRKISDSQTKVSLLADGSLDPTGFEDEVALLAYETSSAELPLMAGPRGSNSSGPLVLANRDVGMLAPVYAHGRHYLPATYADFGPRHHHLHTAAEAAAKVDKLVPNLQTIHGEPLGLAYWQSVSDFIDGCGDEASTYATAVMEHLTSGAHTTVRDTLGYLADRDSRQALEESNRAPKKGGLSLSNLAGIVDWLEYRPVRDRQFTQRLHALTCPMYLRDLSPRSLATAKSNSAAAERPPVSDADKQCLFEKTNRALMRIHDQSQQHSSTTLPSELTAHELDEISEDIYTLAEQMCWSMTGSKQPSARLPALMRAAALVPNTRPLSTRSPAVSPMNNSSAVPPRPNRTMSTPVLNSASLAAAVRSDMMMSNLMDVAESDYGYTR